MSDLISRSALIKNLSTVCGNMDLVLPDQVWDMITAQPTAYDMDSVVESVEKLPQQDFLGVAHIPRTATLNWIRRGGKW